MDDTRNFDGAGDVQTTFYPDDEVYFWVHHDNTLSIADVTRSSGNITDEGYQAFHDMTTELQLIANGETADLKVIPTSITHQIWWGNQATYTRDGRTLTSTFDGPCIGEVSCSFNARLYRYTPPSLSEILLTEDDEWPVLIVIHME